MNSFVGKLLPEEGIDILREGVRVLAPSPQGDRGVGKDRASLYERSGVCAIQERAARSRGVGLEDISQLRAACRAPGRAQDAIYRKRVQTGAHC
jgi:hypothetical protein